MHFVNMGKFHEEQAMPSLRPDVLIVLATSNGVKFQSLTTDGPAPAIEIAFVNEDVESAFKKAFTEGAVEVKKPTKKPYGFLVEICSPVN